MIFTWFKRRRRAKILALPFPAEWEAPLKANLPYYTYLTREEQERLRHDMRVFIAEKNWEGCGGQTITDEVRVTIAAHACLLLLARDHDYFERILSILVYPTGYRAPQTKWQGHEPVGDAWRLGEAWYRGPVILSWADVIYGAQHWGAGHNVVWHEFAHQLDMLDREIDGTPPLEDRAQYRRWSEVMTAEFEKLKTAAVTRQSTLLDTYGATNEAEFFAVTTECFFDRPKELRAEHPALYELLKEFYRQDPAERVARTS